MSLTSRKPRPITRDSASLRDDRLFIIACDDTYAPKQYFDFFKLPRVRITVIPATAGQHSAQRVLDSLLTYEFEPGDQRWLVLDTDHYAQGSHLQSFLPVIQTARQKGIGVALSRPCFELWLLLHHTDEAEAALHEGCKSVDEALRSVLREYNKSNLKPEHYPGDSVKQAIERCRRLDQGTSDIPATNTSRVYRIWDAIAASVLAYQLPWTS